MINSTTEFQRAIGYRRVYSGKSLWVWGSEGYFPNSEALRQFKQIRVHARLAQQRMKLSVPPLSTPYFQIRIYYPPEALITSSE